MDTKWRTPNIRFAVALEHVDDLLEDMGFEGICPFLYQ
jgi:hypothetical protein